MFVILLLSLNKEVEYRHVCIMDINKISSKDYHLFYLPKQQNSITTPDNNTDLLRQCLSVISDALILVLHVHKTRLLLLWLQFYDILDLIGVPCMACSHKDNSMWAGDKEKPC